MIKEAARHPELSPAKREQILDGACALFRECGYERASVDAIASRAGVSKATIYNHFRDKKALFLAVFAVETTETRQRFLSLLETPTGDIESDLRRIAEQLIRLVSAPSHVCRDRIVIAEVDRFPELGQDLHACGSAIGQEKLARFFGRAVGMGLLDEHDPLDAATDFASLCIGTLSRRLYLGVAEVNDQAIAANVDRAVRTFLRAYRRG